MQWNVTTFLSIKQEPFSYVSTVSSNMQWFPPEHVLSGPHLTEVFNPELIRKVLDFLNPQNIRLVLWMWKFSSLLHHFILEFNNLLFYSLSGCMLSQNPSLLLLTKKRNGMVLIIRASQL